MELKERKCRWSVARRRSHLAPLLLAAALLLSPAPVRSDPGGQPNGGSGNSGGSPGNSGNAPGQSKPRHRKTPTERVQGEYEVRIVGYYTGSGSARASGTGIKISASVSDPSGKAMDLQAKNLDVTDDRFTGTGTLDGATVRIDGRLDPQDRKGSEVLKKGRITFTLSANGHHSRGAGEMRTSGPAS
jgi:hypothetical protein